MHHHGIPLLLYLMEYLQRPILKGSRYALCIVALVCRSLPEPAEDEPSQVDSELVEKICLAVASGNAVDVKDALEGGYSWMAQTR